MEDFRKEEIEVSLNRIGKIPVIKHNQKYKDNFYLICILISVGYIPSQKFIENFENISNLKSITSKLLDLKFAGLNWQNTLFPNFPDYVKNNDEAVLKFQTILHYITTYGAENLNIDIPTYFPNPPTKTNKNYKKFSGIIKQKIIVDVCSTKDFYDEVFDELLFTKTPLKESENEFIKNHIEKYTKTINFNKIYFNEVKVLLMEFVNVDLIENIDSSIILRYYINELTGIPTIISNKKVMEKLKNVFSIYEHEKEKFWKLLDKTNPNELSKFYKQKKKLFNILLHLFDVKKYRKTHWSADVLKKLKNNNAKNIITKYGIIENHIKNKSVNELFEFFIQNPYLFVEYATRTLKLFSNLEEIRENKDSFQIILNGLNNKMLLRLNNALSSRQTCSNLQNKNLYVIPFTRVWYDEKDKIEIDKYIINEIIEYIDKILMKRLLDKIENKKIYIDLNNVSLNYALPLTVRGKSGFLVERGSFYNIESPKIRVGIYWKNSENSGCDLDLSAMFLDENFEFSGMVSWNSRYKDNGVVFSGDVTDAPYGASEFIEFDFKDISKNNGYMVISSSRFFGFPESNEFFVGIQESTDFKNEFDPSHLRFNFTAKYEDTDRNLICMIIDTKKKIAYPLLLTSKCRIASNDKSIPYISFSTVEKWSNKKSYYNIISLFSQNGLLENSKNTADIIIEDDIQMQKLIRNIMEI